MGRTKKQIGIFFSSLLFIGFACGRVQDNGIVNPNNPNPNPNGNLTPTLSSIQANTFTPRCGIAPCHVAGGLAPFRLDNAAQSFANLVGVQSLHNPGKSRVAAGNAGNSYLLDIIQGNGVNGAVMPPGGNNLLDAGRIQQINDWIVAGAQNN